MITKNKFTRFVFALLFALSAIGISTMGALADTPVKYEVGPITGSDTFTDLCPFPVELTSTFNIAGIDFYDKDGVLIRSFWHFVTQDTLSANGKTLVGVPYSYNIEVYWDSDGNSTSWYVNGVWEKIPLPKGLYNPAGRGEVEPFSFNLIPDHGTPGKVAGVCAALAP